MDSQVRSILEFISATKRTFIIPVYQRNYSWDKDNCEKLFSDLIDSLESGKKHYFGNIVYYAISTDFASGYSELALIDGQQRVTTIMLLLAALRDLSDDEIAKNNIQGTYLTNPQSTEQNRVKLKQIESDRGVYEAIIAGNYDGNDSSNAGANYQTFKRLIKNSGKSPNEILGAINNLQVVALDLKLKEQGNLSESPQVIFESINATGKKLSDADLIRNWLLIGIPENKQEDFYKTYWLKIESNAGDADGVVDFINRYLTLHLSDKIVKGSEYRTFKKRIDRMFGDSENPYEAAMISLCHYSKYYMWIKHPESVAAISPNVSEIFSNLNEIGNDYAIPALMFLSEKADDPNSIFDFDGLAKASSYIEDWLFRARITRNITTGAVGSVLAGLVQLITKKNTQNGNFDEILYYELSNYRTADIWPNDNDFKYAFSHFDFYNTRFYKNYVQRKLEYYISNDRINIKPNSIEHIMPETLNAHWRGVLGENYAQLHAEYLHTIGNLAPMNQSDNSTNSNDPYEKKRPQFEASSWKLTRDVTDDYSDWNIESIKDRSKKLSELATKIWAAPLTRERQLEAAVKGSSSRIIDDSIRASTFRINRADNHGHIVNCSMCIRQNASGKDIYVLLPGSNIAPVSTTNEYFNNFLKEQRQKFADCLTEKDSKLYVISEIPFDTPSSAAGFCTGHSENGWAVWIDIDTGKNLDSLAREHKANTDEDNTE